MEERVNVGRLKAWCGASLLCLLIMPACTQGDDAGERVDSPEGGEVNPTLVSHQYYGYANPRTGEIKFSSTPFVLDTPGVDFGAAGYLVPGQFGEIPVVQDGVNGSNPFNTFEIEGTGVSIDDAARSAGQTQCPGSNFIFDITVRHFFDKATFNDVFVEFNKIEPGSTHFPYDTDSIPGGLPLDGTIGVYDYGTLSDANSNASSKAWKFERCTNEAFTFEFSILGSCVPEAGETALSACRDNPGYKRLSAGAETSCFRGLNDARCWGENGDGQLTRADLEDSANPVFVSREINGNSVAATQLAGDEFHACSRMSDGSVRCWGRNTDGQLGNGTTTLSTEPVSVVTSSAGSNLVSVSQVVVGENFSCALMNSGNVKCWGDNGLGQLGTGDLTDSLFPRDVVGVGGSGILSGVTQLTNSRYSMCALLDTQEVACWGYNNKGQLGNGTRTRSAVPVMVTAAAGGNLGGVAQISGGFLHHCASTSLGEAHCWGLNATGQIGDGTRIDRLVATPVMGVGGMGTLANVAQIATGQSHSCARLSDGEVRCWGSGSYLAQGSTAIRTTPVVAKNSTNTGNLTGIASLFADDTSTCGKKNDGGITCWGVNSSGQLGNGTTTTALLPKDVLDASGAAPLSNVSKIMVGAKFACALDTAQAVFCWGRNAEGQLATGDQVSTLLPVETLLASDIPTNPLRDIASVSNGETFSCALTTSGNVKCWGDNGVGQLGTGDETGSIYPRDVVGVGGTGTLSGVTQLVSSGLSSCALLDTQEVVCWGFNNKGQLGNGTRTSSTSPVFVQLGAGNLTDIVQISAGLLHTCAINIFGEAFCWGVNATGQLGDGSTTDQSIPVMVQSVGGGGFLNGVVQISAGGFHTCGLLDSGNVVCWGRSGRLGSGVLGNSSVPVEVINTGGATGPLSSVNSIDSKRDHTIALLNDGTVASWGFNSSGQLGDGTTSNRFAPVKVLNGSGTFELLDVREIVAGGLHSCVYLADRSVSCWGDNSSGQLGDGTFTSSLLPVNVAF